tara:strand:- start:357 stop:650 length:294 start_codon:yes stop_codon:yes gene_type:complete
MKTRTKTFIITLLCVIVTIFFAGGGHGTYIPAKVVFPFTMLLTKLNNEINLIGIFLALIQIPIYSAILKYKPKWKYYLFGVHLFAIVLCFYFNTEPF